MKIKKLIEENLIKNFYEEKTEDDKNIDLVKLIMS